MIIMPSRAIADTKCRMLAVSVEVVFQLHIAAKKFSEE